MRESPSRIGRSLSSEYRAVRWWFPAQPARVLLVCDFCGLLSLLCLLFLLPFCLYRYVPLLRLFAIHLRNFSYPGDPGGAV